jgi:hypothetical protein
MVPHQARSPETCCLFVYLLPPDGRSHHVKCVRLSCLTCRRFSPDWLAATPFTASGLNRTRKDVPHAVDPIARMFRGGLSTKPISILEQLETLCRPSQCQFWERLEDSSLDTREVEGALSRREDGKTRSDICLDHVRLPVVSPLGLAWVSGRSPEPTAASAMCLMHSTTRQRPWASTTPLTSVTRIGTSSRPFWFPRLAGPAYIASSGLPSRATPRSAYSSKLALPQPAPAPTR